MKCFSRLWGLAGSLAMSLGWLSPVSAEIVPDSTLPQPSRLTRIEKRTIITEGTRRGRNLFHSFREFSVGPGEIASFQNIDPGLSNIFARVTGSNPSRINGVVEALQTDRQISSANLFLINPNGILFGRNAALNLGGSFIASTAESIQFADGTRFSAIPTQTSPLLTVSTPIGLQFGNQPGPIVNRSIEPLRDANGNLIFSSFVGEPLTGLNGTVNHTLALIGGEVIFAEGGSISSNGGRIEIGSVGSGELATLTPIAEGWDIRYPGVERFGDIRFSGGFFQGQARIDSGMPIDRDVPTGAIQIQGRRITLNSALIFPVTTERSGQPVNIIANDTVLIDGSYLGTASTASGQAGDLIISTGRLVIRGGGQIGSVAGQQSGNVRVNAADSVIIGDILPDSPGLDPADRLSSLAVRTVGDGKVGNLEITTPRLEVRDGGQISAATTGSNDAGNITIQATEIELTGVAIDPRTNLPLLSEQTGLPLAGGLFVGTSLGSSGNGGTLNITTDRLQVRDGATIQATTYGRGQAGNVQIQANLIEVSGASAQNRIPAQIAAASGGLPAFNPDLAATATGGGGNLDLQTNRLIIRDGGIVSVNSRNPNAAGAGNIRIQANQVLLDNQGQLNAQTESGNQARIRLEEVELLSLRRNSSISTRAGRNSQGGDAGNIDVDSNFILAAPAENNDIDANARLGEGGDIAIQAEGILGIRERQRQTAQSDITATSESNVDGNISIDTTTIDPTQGIIELPSAIVDASRLIAQGCRAYQDTARTTGEFVITGRGGLPPTPADLRGSSAVITNWGTLPPVQPSVSQSGDERQSWERTPHRIAEPPMLAANLQPDAGSVVEAQGWIKDDAGQVMLVTQAPTAIPHAPIWSAPSCDRTMN